MRIKTIKINGQDHKAVLLCGVTGLVKVYNVYGFEKPFLFIGKQKFTLQDDLNSLVLKFINLKYQPLNEQKSIEEAFIRLCKGYL